MGWSYGGFVICDYLRAYGTAQIAGINFVGAAVTLSTAAFGTLIGPGFLDNIVGATTDDLPTNIDAIRSFVRACTYSQLPNRGDRDGDLLEHGRAGQDPGGSGGPCDQSDEVLAALTLPVLMSQEETGNSTGHGSAHFVDVSQEPSHPGTPRLGTPLFWRIPIGSTLSYRISRMTPIPV